jgi:hypothetical protein
MEAAGRTAVELDLRGHTGPGAEPNGPQRAALTIDEWGDPSSFNSYSHSSLSGSSVTETAAMGATNAGPAFGLEDPVIAA